MITKAEVRRMKWKKYFKRGKEIRDVLRQTCEHFIFELVLNTCKVRNDSKRRAGTRKYYFGRRRLTNSKSVSSLAFCGERISICIRVWGVSGARNSFLAGYFVRSQAITSYELWIVPERGFRFSVCALFYSSYDCPI